MELNLNTTDFVPVGDIEVPDIFNRRLKTGINKIDELLGGGFLPGSSFTLTATAGCGKTTFALQTLEALTKNGYSVAYASGEESVFQLAHTCKRLGVERVRIANQTDVEELCKIANDFDVIIVDSFQSLTTNKIKGYRAIEKHAVQHLVKAGKDLECTIGFIMHLTKGGELKGGTIVPHTVDLNLKIDPMPGADECARLIYIDRKNRFGPLGDCEAVLGHRGYDFNAKIVKETDETKVANKKTRKQEEMDTLRNHDVLNVPQACSLINCDPTRVTYLLRELTVLGEFKKTGRGVEAVWHKQRESKLLPFAAEPTKELN